MMLSDTTDSEYVSDYLELCKIPRLKVHRNPVKQLLTNLCYGTLTAITHVDNYNFVHFIQIQIQIQF